jgi:hypothetical protein
MTPEERRQRQAETRRLGDIAYRRWRRLRWRIWGEVAFIVVCLGVAAWAMWMGLR